MPDGLYLANCSGFMDDLSGGVRIANAEQVTIDCRRKENGKINYAKGFSGEWGEYFLLFQSKTQVTPRNVGAVPA